jgi:hypothetical protein
MTELKINLQNTYLHKITWNFYEKNYYVLVFLIIIPYKKFSGSE